jgi:hypothetical protein
MEWKLGRFGWLLISLVGLLLMTPVLDFMDFDVPRSRLLSTIVLLVGMYSLRRDPWMFRAGFMLATLALVSAWLSQRFVYPALVVGDFLLTGGFLGFTTALILGAILAEDRVTLDTVMGGVCIYLLLGVLWVSLYSAVEYMLPGSFVLHGTTSLTALADSTQEVHRYPELLYFSFVTLTTLGYGDIVPTNQLARALATGEAIVGQVYLGVFVASLVGLHLADRRSRYP